MLALYDSQQFYVNTRHVIEKYMEHQKNGCNETDNQDHLRFLKIEKEIHEKMFGARMASTDN